MLISQRNPTHRGRLNRLTAVVADEFSQLDRPATLEARDAQSAQPLRHCVPTLSPTTSATSSARRPLASCGHLPLYCCGYDHLRRVGRAPAIRQLEGHPGEERPTDNIAHRHRELVPDPPRARAHPRPHHHPSGAATHV